MNELMKNEKIKEIKNKIEKKIGREISDEDFLQGILYVIQKAEKRKKKLNGINGN